MTSEFDINEYKLGPGPSLIYNEDLNELQSILINRQKILRGFRSGVIHGLFVNFIDGDDANPATIQVNPGAAVVEGRAYKYETTRIEVPAFSSGNEVWVYLDEDGVIRVRNSTSTNWPRLNDIREQRDLPVLAIAKKSSHDTWSVGSERDVRLYAREKPIASHWVVGQPRFGSDFETVHQALAFIEASDKGGNPVSRRILIRENQDLGANPLEIRIPNIVLEGTAESAASEKAQIRWTGSCAVTFTEDALNCSFRNIHFIPYSSPDAAFHMVEDGFELKDCIIGDPDNLRNDSSLPVEYNYSVDTVIVPRRVIIGMKAINNRIFGVRCVFDSTEGIYEIQDSDICQNEIWGAVEHGYGHYGMRLALNTNTSYTTNRVENNFIADFEYGIIFNKSAVISGNTVKVLKDGIFADNYSVQRRIEKNTIVLLNSDDQSQMNRVAIRFIREGGSISDNTITIEGTVGNGIVQGAREIIESDAIGDQMKELRTVTVPTRDGGTVISGNKISATEAAVQIRGYGICTIWSNICISDNTIERMAEGIMVSAGCRVINNRMNVVSRGIVAWKNNTICGNSIEGPDTDNIGDYYYGAWGNLSLGAIVISKNNILKDNRIKCDHRFNYFEGIHVYNWTDSCFGWSDDYETSRGLSLFGGDYRAIQDSSVRLTEGYNNTISGSVIEVSTNGSTGIKTRRVFVRGAGMDLQTLKDRFPVYPEVNGNRITNCIILPQAKGIEVDDGTVHIDNCKIYDCAKGGVWIENGPYSSLSCTEIISSIQNDSSQMHEEGIVSLGRRSHYVSIRDCKIEQMFAHEEDMSNHCLMYPDYEDDSAVPCITLLHPDTEENLLCGVNISGCELINRGCVCISFCGVEGAISDCVFDGRPNLSSYTWKHPAVVFAQWESDEEEPREHTFVHNNLIWGCDMYNCTFVQIRWFYYIYDDESFDSIPFHKRIAENVQGYYSPVYGLDDSGVAHYTIAITSKDIYGFNPASVDNGTIVEGTKYNWRENNVNSVHVDSCKMEYNHYDPIAIVKPRPS